MGNAERKSGLHRPVLFGIMLCALKALFVRLVGAM